MTSPTPPTHTEEVIPLHAEEMSIERSRVVSGTLRVKIHTETRQQEIDESLEREHVEVERVTVGRVVDSVPPVREEGNTTIIPVMEEIVVVERRLILKEEIHLHRVRITGRHQEKVALREQHAIIERA